MINTSNFQLLDVSSVVQRLTASFKREDYFTLAALKTFTTSGQKQAATVWVKKH